MGSRPRVRVTLDGEVLDHVMQVTVEQPEGAATSTCTIRLAGPRAVTASSTVKVEFGYAGNSLDTLLDTTEMQSSLYTIEPRQDSLSVTWASTLDRLRRRAPLATEFWPGRGKTLRDFARFIAGKVGYTTLVDNLPAIPMPARVPIQPADGYWATLTKIIEPLRPEIAPDDERERLSIWWLDAKIPGAAIALPIGRAEAIPQPKTVRQKVNVALLKYLWNGNDGGALLLDCASLGDTFNDPTGQFIGSTSAACAVEVDPEADADLVQVTTHEGAPGATEGEQIDRVDTFAVVYDPSGAVVGAPVLTRSVTTAYAPDDVARMRPVYTTETVYRFIRGTNYQHSAGHRSTTSAPMDMPLAGLLTVADVYSETETIEYKVTADYDLVKYRSVKETRGRVLEPDHVPLYEAVTNRAVRTGDDTYQWTTSDQALTWEIEELQPMGGSAKYLRRRYNYLTARWEAPGDQGDAVGQVPSTSDLAARTVEETYPDPATGGTEPADGWQIPVTIDGTWIGTGVLVGVGADPLTARAWCVRMADAMFRRAGSRIATYTATFAKYLSKIRRGVVVTTARRGQSNPHKGIVTAVTITATWVGGNGGYHVTTDLVARRLEPGDDV